MSILTENSKKMLVESMRECLSEVLHESTSLTSKQATEKIKFVTESATYEQLLNITLNPRRQEKYQPAYVLEGAVAILHSACMTGRKHIGPNAIAEGALKLQKKTGAVITESMLDAALVAVNEGAGLKIVGKLLTEARLSPEMQTAINNLINFQANASKSGVPVDMVGLNASLRAAGIQDPINVIKQVQNGASPLKAVAASRTLSRIEGIKAQLKRGGLTHDQIMRMRGELGVLEKKAARHSGAAGSSIANNLSKTLNNSGVGKTPWGKIALGATALAGAGTLGYQYYKNKKAMNRDINAGIEQ